MAPVGLCPRCGGTDIYFAKRQRISGLGGIYGNRGKMVNTPLCRACGEVANFNYMAPENKEWRKEITKANRQQGKVIFKIIGIAFGIVFLLLGVVTLFVNFF